MPFAAYMACVSVIILTLAYEPRIGLYLLAFLIPLEGMLDKFVTLGYPFGKDMKDMLIIAVTIGIFLHKRDKISLSEKKLNRIILLLIPLTYSALLVGSFKLGFSLPISSENPQVRQWKNFILLPALYFLTINTIKDKKQMALMLWIMAISLFLTDFNFYQNNKLVSHDHFSWDKRTNGTTFSFLGPNEIAAFYTQMAVLLTGVLLTDRNRLRQAAFLAIVAFNVYTILYLYSRGAYVALIAGLLFYALIKSRMLLVLLIVVFISWQSVLPTAVVERIEMTKTDEGVDASSMDRVELWMEALSYIKANPLTGMGFGSSRYLGFKTDDKAYRRDVHNGFIEVLLEQGIVGLSTLLAIFIMSAKKGWKLYRESNDDFMKGLGIGFVGMIISVIFTNMFGDRWSYYNVMGDFWIILGMVVLANQMNIKETANVPLRLDAVVPLKL